MAIQARVFPDEFPTSIAHMVKRGRPPLLCSVATGAVSSHARRMNVLALVAADARGVRDPERMSRMTLLAWNRDVQAKKRKFRQIVIEVDHRLPTLGQVALVARGTQPGAVNVARPMTAHALRR